MTPSEKIARTPTALSMFFIVVMVASVAFAATGEQLHENQEEPLCRDPGDQGGPNGTDNGTGDDNETGGNETGEEGNQTGSGNETGENGNQTGSGNETGGNGNQTGSGNETGGNGNQTGSGNETGGNGNQTGSGNETGGNGNQNDSGNETGGNGNQNGSGNETGGNGNQNGSGNETGGNGNQNGSGNETGGNGSGHQYEHGPDDAAAGHYSWNWSNNASREQLKNEWQEDKVNNSWRHRFRNEIQTGLENGTVIMEANIGKKDGTLTQEKNQYRNGSEMHVEKANGTAIRVRISAEFKEGKVIVLNIDDEALGIEDVGDVVVTFDGEAIEMGSIEEVLNAKGSKAKYVVALDENGAQFLVYIPHFSEHTIEITSVNSLETDDTKEDTLSASYILIIIGVVLFVGVFVYIIKSARRR